MDIESRIKRPRHVRIITVGNVEAGKTSIIKRYCEGRFSVKYHATIGVDYGKTKVSVEGIEIMANIFDLSGHPVFKIVRTEFYSNIDAVLLVYDISDSSSSGERAEALERWLHEMAEGMDNTSVVCVVCGNKSDRRARVQNKDVERWVDMHKFSHFVVSALNGIGIREMFQSLLMQVLKVQETGRDPIALWSSCNYSKEELQAVHQVRWSRSEYEKLGLDQRASKDDINRSYRRLAVLLHPDKSTAPGCEEAFKMLVAARTALLKRVVH
ncbi:dnaJ homolog subfamily C member 27 isoform X1 [Rhipicephalus microplus]|uniref:dnaJ homolog subfamily C member 27 isoform X1 n=1 Tax=Rhipicephalus microplus TaxID=6941 RepID=UPI001887DC9F|nr:dnaJ homolog subfamily C member 27-like [Rhipicephalus microplus]